MSQSENPRAHCFRHRNNPSCSSAFIPDPSERHRYGPTYFTRIARKANADRTILHILTHRIRVVTVEIAGLEFADALCRLKLRGLVDSARIHLSLPTLSRPLQTWNLGDPPPDVGALAWQLTNRWRQAPLRTVKVFYATHLATRFSGGRGGALRQPFQVAHDLLVARVFFHLVRRTPHLSPMWIPDFLLPTIAFPGRKRPDAVILNDDGDPSLVIEVATNSYARDRLQGLHDDCERCGLPYEIW